MWASYIRTPSLLLNRKFPCLVPHIHGVSGREGWGIWDFNNFSYDLWASLVAQMIKNLHAMQETWDQSLDWKDPLEKGMTTHSSVLAWRISWTEEPRGLQSVGSQRVRHSWVTNTLRFWATAWFVQNRESRAFARTCVSLDISSSHFKSLQANSENTSWA